MAESQTQSADIQLTLAAILANMWGLSDNMQTIRDENETSVQPIREDAINKTKLCMIKTKKYLPQSTIKASKTKHC